MKRSTSETAAMPTFLPDKETIAGIICDMFRKFDGGDWRIVVILVLIEELSPQDRAMLFLSMQTCPESKSFISLLQMQKKLRLSIEKIRKITTHVRNNERDRHLYRLKVIEDREWKEVFQELRNLNSKWVFSTNPIQAIKTAGMALKRYMEKPNQDDH